MHFVTWSSSPTAPSLSATILFVERSRFRWSTARYGMCPGSHPCRTYDILKEEREGKEDDIGFTASGMKRASMQVDVVSAKMFHPSSASLDAKHRTWIVLTS